MIPKPEMGSYNDPDMLKASENRRKTHGDCDVTIESLRQQLSDEQQRSAHRYQTIQALRRWKDEASGLLRTLENYAVGHPNPLEIYQRVDRLTKDPGATNRETDPIL